MPACPRTDEHSSLPPPGFTNDSSALKRVQLTEALKKVIEKCQSDPQFFEQQEKQTDLLLSIAQFTLLQTPISPDDRRDFVNNIMTIGQALLTDGNQVNNEEISLSINSNMPTNEIKDVTVPVLPYSISNNDGDFSLDDLANEYLQNEPTPVSSNEKPTPSSESGELVLSPNDLNKNDLSSSPVTNILSKLMFAPLLNEPLTTKPQLESILFSNRLSSHDAADDADGIWKEESSSLGQMLCTKTNDTQIPVTKRITTCLLDHSLYERLARLIELLPKQCVRNNIQQLSVKSNGQQYRSQRSNNENRRTLNRPSFQQNSAQVYHTQRFPNMQNARPYMNYQNQPEPFNGHYVDRRAQQQQQPEPFNGHFVDRRAQQQQQQPNRYGGPSSSFVPHSGERQYQQKGPPKHNPYGGGNQQQKKQQQRYSNNNQQAPQQQYSDNNQQAPQQQYSNNNQQAPQQEQQQQRGTKKGSSNGGNKLTNEKSGVPGSGPSLKPK